MTTLSKQTPSHLQNAEEEEEGQWKNLPNDILSLLLRHFHTKPDLCRFRSICKSWRFFATPLQPHLLFPLILPPLTPGSSSFSLSPQFLYIFSPNSTHNNNDCWLTKVVEFRNNNNKWLVTNPLATQNLDPYLPRVCKNGLNLLGFRNHEVGRSYRIQLVSGDTITIGELKKVVVLTNDTTVSVLGLNKDGQIVLWNYGDQYWNIIDTSKEKNNLDFDDIICYDQKFYAVDRIGRLVMINPGGNREVVESRMDDYSVQSFYSAAYSAECTSKLGCECYNTQTSYLVESDFRLYMVTHIDIIPVFFDDELEVEVEVAEWAMKSLEISVERPDKFRVYVLNEREMSWERVDSLGHKVFFVSGDTVFSANAADLGLTKGNCIYFKADMGFGNGNANANAGAYSLEDETIVTCDSTVDHRARIFCPPMGWFVQNH